MCSISRSQSGAHGWSTPVNSLIGILFTRRTHLFSIFSLATEKATRKWFLPDGFFLNVDFKQGHTKSTDNESRRAGNQKFIIMANPRQTISFRLGGVGIIHKPSRTWESPSKTIRQMVNSPPSTMEPLLPARHQSSISTAGRFLDGHSSRTPNKTHPKGFYTRSIIWPRLPTSHRY